MPAERTTKPIRKDMIHNVLRMNGMTITKLAQKTLYAPSSLRSKISVGVMSDDMREAVCKALGIDPNALVDWSMIAPIGLDEPITEALEEIRER